jgi:type II secretory pathway pseudopilin PulG
VKRFHLQGAALVTSLVVLAVLSILASAGMKTARLELMLTDSQRLRQQAFDAAEAGIETMFAAIRLDGRVTTGPLSGTREDGSTFIVTVVLKAITLPPPAADDAPAHTADIRAVHFEIRATATAPRDARATHLQGFYALVPHLESQSPCLDDACAAAIDDCSDHSCFSFDSEQPLIRTGWAQVVDE